MRRLEALCAQLEEAQRKFAEFGSGKDFSRIQSDLEKQELEPLHVMTKEEWEEEKDGG